MFVRLRPDFSAMAAKTHVSDSAVPWRGASTSYDQVQLTCPLQSTIDIMWVSFVHYSALPCLSNPRLWYQSSL